ncbi:hypothetical protein [Phytohabitans houttuyneae]|uniref:hypothetical protein n=1 Tax=Phytohabitans houttuyneae TaxID=1076126 RepID=UPI001563E1F3|nr:hypothetical protein [Phytohabitans houttuyneae]
MARDRPGLADAAEATGDHSLNLVDLTTGRSTLERDLAPYTLVRAVLDSGEILTVDLGADAGASLDGDEPLGVPDPSSAERSLPLAVRGALRPGERLDMLPNQVLADGSSVLVRTWLRKTVDDVVHEEPDDILGLDGAAGTVSRRLALPDPVFEVGGGPFDTCEVVASAPEGILVWHRGLAGSVELELLDRETGRLAVVTRPADDRIDDLRPRGYAP